MKNYRSIIGLALTILGMGTSFAMDQGVTVYPFPHVGPIVREVTPNSVVFMGQGDPHHQVQGVFRYSKITDADQSGVYSIPLTFPMEDSEYNVGHALLSKLDPGSKYQIQIGYLLKDQDLNQVNWEKAHTFTFHTLAQEKSDFFSFQLGSCRRLADIVGIKLWADKGDKIFEAMLKDAQITQASGGKTDLIAFIGDQIYADATPFDECKSEKDYIERYQLAFSQYFIRQLMAIGIPVYMMRDDHEWWNDAHKEEQESRPDQNAAAKKSYDLFQRPRGKYTDNWWYSVGGDIDIFFMDTRSEREPSKNIMISQEQMDGLKAWLSKDELKDRIKVIVSSVPMLLLDTEDSWGGYKAQLAELLAHITTNDIKHVMVLSGDAHCQNDSLFTISDDKGNEKGKILEVLVSGLYAVKRNKAGLLSNQMDLKEHGFFAKDDAGLKSTLTKNLFARISGNHKDKTVSVWVYDKNNNLLRKTHYDLK